MANLTGTITKAITFAATAAIIKQFAITITQTANQTITVRKGSASGDVLASGAKVDYGTKLYISIAANSGYTAGTVSVSGAEKNDDGSYTVTAETTITATAASQNTYTVTITQTANQTIHVYVPNKSDSAKVDHTEAFTAPEGTAYEAEVIAADGYTAGTLSVN